MSISITQILRQELERLSGAFGSTPICDDATARDRELETVFHDLATLRSSVNDIARRRAHELSKDQLIELQSGLNARLDELFAVEIERLIERRALAVSEQAERDPVTTLPNRAAFDRRLRDEIARARRYGRELSVVLFDVDRFKSVNDQFGHPAGDQALLQVARILKSSLRQSDAVFRYGGDEFAAVCPETSGAAMAHVLRRLDSNLRVPGIEAHSSRQLGLSWGAASFPADAVEEGELIRIADERLYDCKRAHHRSFAAGLSSICR
jgi:diguanylate cyclase (GGDEF)-like protein